MRRVVLAPFAADGPAAAASSSSHDGVSSGNGGANRGRARNSGQSSDGSSATNDGSAEKDGSPTNDSGWLLGDGAAAARPPTITSPAFAAGASVPNVPSCDGAGEAISLPFADEYELSVCNFPMATLPSASDPTSPDPVEVQANKTAAGTIVGKYTRE